MDLLAGTPYLLDEANARRVLAAVKSLDDEIALLRKKGTLDPETLGRLRKEWGIRQAHESTAIEGNELTLSETEMAIQRGITISGKPPEHSEEVRNLYGAQEYLETLATSQTPITEREIREIQALVVGRGHRGAGAYRKIEVEITNSPHKPPHPIKVPELMSEYAAWLASPGSVPPLLLAAVCHAWLVHIHPFEDGNGRTARAVTNLLLIRHGYPIVLIRRKDRERYYEALRASDEGDITPLLDLVLDRAQDSLHQIDRARAAVTGVSLAVQKVREQEERRYRIWSDALRLFGSTLESLAKNLEAADPRFHVATQRYDLPSLEDYRDLCSRDPAGNTWFLKLRIGRGKVERPVLLWIGYSSDVLNYALELEHPIPAVKVSVQNPTPPPAWLPAGDDFPSSAREFAYNDGKYYRVGDGGSVNESTNVVVLASNFLEELVEGWFAKAV